MNRYKSFFIRHPYLLWTSVICLLTILLCSLPMSLSPGWSTAPFVHCTQYEDLADRMLEGHIDIDYPVDPRLLAMENPYDVEERERLEVDFPWDHAYYNGKFYVYFGVVPTITLYLPWRIITGHRLLGYYGTQFYVALFIIGIFALFWLLRRRFFKELPIAAYYSLCFVSSIASTLCATMLPALYSTAQASAFALMTWSLFFYIKAVYDTERESRAIVLAFVGATLGAMVFGCRPTIALANLIALPMAITFVKHRGCNIKTMGKVALVILPYIIIGIALMYYNYIRFERPFEFGQAYQLTLADQSGYTDILSQINLHNIRRSLSYYLFDITDLRHLHNAGILISFPCLLLGFVLACWRRVWRAFYDNYLFGFLCCGTIATLLCIVMTDIYSPIPCLRYKYDMAWLVFILAFLSIGFAFQKSHSKRVLSVLLGLTVTLSIVGCVVIFCTPYAKNAAEILPQFNILHLGVF